MNDDNTEVTSDIEQEKTESFELGHISQLEDMAEELRERSGEEWAQANSQTEIEKARQLKELAKEFEKRAETKRDVWEEEYRNRPQDTDTDRPGELRTDGGESVDGESDHPLMETVAISDDAEFGDLREFAETQLRDSPVEVEDLRLAEVELTFVSKDGNKAAYSVASKDYDPDNYEEV